MKSLIPIFVISLTLYDCATGSHIITGNVRTPIDPDGVKLYSEPPPKYAVIGTVSFLGTAWTSKRQKEQMLHGLKVEAAKIGANGIVLGNMAKPQVRSSALWTFGCGPLN